MSKSVEQLITSLTREYEIYKDYLDLAYRKKEAIIQGNMKELDHLTKIEQNLVIQAGKIDQVRTAIIGNILLEKKLAFVETVTELSNHLEEREKVIVLALRDKLQSLLQEIKEINELNGKLIEQSLEYIDFQMNLVTSVGNQGSTYGNQAKEKDLNARTSLFDAKF